MNHQTNTNRLTPRKCIAVILSVLMVISLMPMTVFAADIEDEGNCGTYDYSTQTFSNDVAWQLFDDGTLRIYVPDSAAGDNKGKMADFSDPSNYDNENAIIPPWYQYRAQITNLIIENGVTVIGQRAFYNYDSINNEYLGYSLGSLVIPETVDRIEDGAFYSCGFNGTLTFETDGAMDENGVEYIYDSAFYNCKGFIGNLTLPNTLQYIGASAFQECDGFNGFLTLLSLIHI